MDFAMNGTNSDDLDDIFETFLGHPALLEHTSLLNVYTNKTIRSRNIRRFPCTFLDG